ncbi:hypothetical protein HNO89_000913 [Sporosarcina luteola]|nr:hypothetical protein [Sporosarcina luteola]
MENVRTAGAYVLYNGFFVFQVGPTPSGKKLGIVRLGGHREQNEYPLDTAIREVKEEAAITVKPIDSLVTYYLDSWVGKPIKLTLNDNIKPILIKGNKDELFTVMYLALTDNEPKPSSESKGLIFLSLADVELICSRQVTFNEFLARKGLANINEDFDKDLVLEPFPQLVFLSKLLKQEPDSMKKFIECSKSR